MKIWIYWSESNSWIYFYIYLNKNWKIYWSYKSFTGLRPEPAYKSFTGLRPEPAYKSFTGLRPEPVLIVRTVQGNIFWISIISHFYYINQNIYPSAKPIVVFLPTHFFLIIAEILLILAFNTNKSICLFS